MSSSPFIDKLNKFYNTSPTQPSEPVSNSSTMALASTATREDDRGFTKTGNYEMMNPKEANFQDTGKTQL